MRYFVTGAAGFIGSNLVDRLIARGDEVVGFDNFSTGFEQFLVDAGTNPSFTLVRGDLLDPKAVHEAMAGCDFVFHLAANADVRFGFDHPERDLQQNTIATFNVLEAMRANGVKKIGFSSTGSIYGEPEVFPTPEDAPFPLQTSLYGASKLACEGMISAYCEGYDFQSWIFRFVSVLGERYTHGHIFDFYRNLTLDPGKLSVLGNGQQQKSYMHIDDCLAAMLLALGKAKDKVNVLNIGTDGTSRVVDSIGWICAHMGISPDVSFAGGERGWIGDSPYILLDCTRLRALGWTPKLTIEQGVVRTVQWIEQNPWILEGRP